tara:strand:+ start:274 stop:486 length:213 start_codon:yes stop_codon:yes gene_type:complete
MIVRSAAHFVGVMFILTIVFPETDGADFEPSTFVQCPELATWASIFLPGSGRMIDVAKGQSGLSVSMIEA